MPTNTMVYNYLDNEAIKKRRDQDATWTRLHRVSARRTPR
jgi:hypothetical protein